MKIRLSLHVSLCLEIGAAATVSFCNSVFNMNTSTCSRRNPYYMILDTHLFWFFCYSFFHVPQLFMLSEAQIVRHNVRQVPPDAQPILPMFHVSMIITTVPVLRFSLRIACRANWKAKLSKRKMGRQIWDGLFVSLPKLSETILLKDC